jgi:hypothetical protein
MLIALIKVEDTMLGLKITPLTIKWWIVLIASRL